MPAIRCYRSPGYSSRASCHAVRISGEGDRVRGLSRTNIEKDGDIFSLGRGSKQKNDSPGILFTKNVAIASFSAR